MVVIFFADEDMWLVWPKNVYFEIMFDDMVFIYKFSFALIIIIEPLYVLFFLQLDKLHGIVVD